MPIHIDAHPTDQFDLAELVRWLTAEKIDTADQGDFMRAAPALRNLASNKQFLADLAIEELKQGITGKTTVYQYSAQVMLLHLPEMRSDNFYVRANFWPSENDQPVKAAGIGPFFYNRPHDHNFNFLTVGYYGPGYWSNYYEYDHDAVAGYPGEGVPSLTFVEKRALQEGHVMFYRASVDVHDQLPADSMSISLNILENTPRVRLTDQYSFDLERARIKQIINISLAPCVFDVTASLGGENGRDVLDEIIRHSPDPFMRFCAYKAVAGSFADPDSYAKEMSRALSDDSRLVSTWAGDHLDHLRATGTENEVA